MEGSVANLAGKRYLCTTCGSEFIVTKGGAGQLECHGSPMVMKTPGAQPPAASPATGAGWATRRTWRTSWGSASPVRSAAHRSCARSREMGTCSAAVSQWPCRSRSRCLRPT